MIDPKERTKWLRNAAGEVTGCVTFGPTRQMTPEELKAFQLKMKDAPEFKEGDVISVEVDTAKSTVHYSKGRGTCQTHQEPPTPKSQPPMPDPRSQPAPFPGTSRSARP